MEGYFEIGVITGTHGIKGTFKVFPTTEDPKRFELLKEVIIEHKNKQEIFKIAKVAYHKNLVLLTVKGIDDINVAELYKRDRILIADTEALPLEEDEYYARDILGMEVFTNDGERLGTIEDIYETGANDVYAIKDGEESKELLIPAIKQCILEVNKQDKKMIIKLLEGLRD